MASKMASYPPPPPPPGQGYGSGYDRRAWKMQRRMMQAQARAQRAQYRMQRRSLRRGSMVGPLVLLALGVVLLLEQMGRLSWGQSLAWYARWWPVVLIVAGVILLVEWLLDQQRQEETGLPRTTHVLGAGVVFLLILLASIGWSARWTESGAAWKHRYIGHDLGGLDRVFGQAHESDDSLSYTLPQGATLVVHDPWGAVSVTGSSDDGQVHVSVHKEVYAWRDSDADARQRQMQPTFSTQGSNLMLDVHGVEQGQADLTIEVPRSTPVAVNADHGDVHVSELHAAVTIASRAGDLDLSAIDGTVMAHINNDDASVTARSLTGAFTLEGRAGDISLSNIDGPVMLQGDFFGTTHAEQIKGPLRFETSRTHFATARVDGELDVESGDLQGNRLFGPVTLSSRDRTIELDDVAGAVKVSNRNGAVTVTSAAPLGPVDIENQHGSVDLGLPGSSGFVLDAQTHNGDMENDFGLETQGKDEQHQLAGTIGGGGPKIHVATSDGDVTIRKSIEPPVPPKPPAPPKISVTPRASGGAEAGPRAPRMPRTPKVAKPEAAPGSSTGPTMPAAPSPQAAPKPGPGGLANLL
ncbi:MAG TPA: DUF4097 family beta strand repeat-containing protein [Acidobacteriaceae bacterium]